MNNFELGVLCVYERLHGPEEKRQKRKLELMEHVTNYGHMLQVVKGILRVADDLSDEKVNREAFSAICDLEYWEL